MDRFRLGLTRRKIRHAASRRVTRVYEIGYGTGALLRRFLDEGVSVGGTDPGALHVQVDPAIAGLSSVGTLPVEQVIAGSRYDLVYSIHVIEHVADPRAFMRASVRLLEPGGVLLLVTPAGDSTSLRRFRSSWWMLEDPTHVRFFSMRSLATMLGQEGLTDVRIRRPVLDSLAVEAASLIRTIVGDGAPPSGVLRWWWTRAAVLVSLPVVVSVRVLRPRWRPTLVATARLPEAL